ncbi:MAG: flagellar hook protein FlgE, partial [Pseudomonas sp.]
MAFNIGLSGLRAASNDLNVTGNNIANAGTAGFKQSRAEFSDVYAASVLGSGSNAQGSGVLLADVSQLFNQGNINYTQNALDMAINGNGFFVTSNNGEISYTRAGYFGTDRDGFIVDNFSHRLQGYPVDANGNILSGVQGDLQVQTDNQAPKATSAILQNFNLNSTDLRPINAATFSPSDPLSYNSSTSLNIYDSQGNPHVMTQYFVKNAAPATNQWTMNVLIDGVNPLNPANTTPLSFTTQYSTAGQLQTITAANAATAAATSVAATNVITFNSDADGTPSANGWVPAVSNGLVPPSFSWNGALGNQPGFTFDPRGSTQFSSSFAVNSISQNGYTTGQLAGLEIDDTGLIFARYTNGQSKVQGQVALASFANMQGLT